METLTLNDGTVVNGHILDNGDGQAIFVYLDGMSIVQGVTLFSDPVRTCRITAMNHGTESVYEEYTELWAASQEYGNCNLVMRKGGNNA
jgi:hypothetical protein